MRLRVGVIAVLATCAGGGTFADTHRATFERGGTGGFSRGGWDEDVDARRKGRDGRLGLGLWGWSFTSRDGRVTVSRIGKGKGLGACDLGAGRGGPWPRPLVNGGLFVREPRPGFGPYQLPVAFQVKLRDVNGFLGAAGPADGRPKFLGVVVEVETADGHRIVCGGLKGGRGLRCGVYELPEYRALAEKAPPALKGAITIRAVCTRERLTLVFGQVQCAVPLRNARSVRAIAFRVAGVVGPAGPVDRAAVIDEMSLSAPNVPRFPERAVPAPKPGGPFLRWQGARLLLGTKDFRAVGMNHTRLLYHVAGLDANPAFGEHVLGTLAGEKFTVLRVACTEHAPHFDKRGRGYAMFRLFERDRAAYFAGFDRLVAAAQKAGVRLVPVLIWNASNVADHLGTSAYGKPDFAAIRRTYLDPSSREHGFLKRYLTALAGRYREHGAILCWEIGNEWQNTVPKTARYYRYNPKGETPNPYVPRWKQRWEDTAEADAWEQIRRAQEVCARILKSADPNHPVLSAAESVSIHFGPDNRTYAEVMRKMVPAEVDLVGYHQYANSLGRRPMKPWGYAPFLVRAGLRPWDAQLAVIGGVAAGMHGGRPVVIGETNVHYDPRPDVQAGRLGNLRDLLMAAANVSPAGDDVQAGGPPRASVVLGWKWVPLPDLVDGYSLYPQSCRHLYGRRDLDPFVERRVQLFRQLLGWYGK